MEALTASTTVFHQKRKGNDTISEINLYRSKTLPHIIIGDFDSIRTEVKNYYEQRGVKIFHNKDQDTTDLEKCVYYVFENSESLTKYEKKDSPKNVLM